MSEIYTYLLPTKIIHGRGSLSRAGAELKALGGRKALLVTDPGIVAAGIAGRVAEVLQAASVESEFFTGVKQMATVGAAVEGCRLADKVGCDGVVAVGGGSVLAVGKAIAVMATNGGDFHSLVGVSPLPRKPLPVVAIPTTAGSGSEVSQFIPLVDEVRGNKRTVGGPECFPPVAILEPELLQSVPYMQALYSGADALTHAIEAMWTTLATPITDTLALAAIEMLANNLRPAALTGSQEARERCLLGSAMANMACGNARLGLVHHLNRFLNGLFPQVPYGLGIGVFLIRVMEFNLPAALERFARMAKAMGEADANLTLRQEAEGAIHAVKRLFADLGFPRAFSPSQVDQNRIPEMAEAALAMPCPNLRRANFEELVELYRQAFVAWDL